MQTTPIRNAVATGVNLTFPPGTYCTGGSISVRSGQTIEVQAGAEIRLCGNTGPAGVFVLQGVSNARVIGAGSLRDTSTSDGSGNNWRRFGVEIRGGSDITVSGLTMRDFWADGIYLESHYTMSSRVDPVRITVVDVKTRGISRNGMTLNVGTDITVDRLDCRDVSDWVNTGVCLFVEPNVTDQPLTRVVVNDLHSQNNIKALVVGLVQHDAASPPVDITLNRPVSVGDQMSFDIRNNYWGAPGNVRINDARSVDSGWRAVNHYRTNGNGFRTTFTNLSVTRYGAEGGRFPAYAVYSYADNSSISSVGAYQFGNLHVDFAHVPTRHPIVTASGSVDVRVFDNRTNAQRPSTSCREIRLFRSTGVGLTDSTGCVTRS